VWGDPCGFKSRLRHHKKVGWGFYPNDNKFVGLKAQPTSYDTICEEASERDFKFI